jgi:hypothetical protein
MLISFLGFLTFESPLVGPTRDGTRRFMNFGSSFWRRTPAASGLPGRLGVRQRRGGRPSGPDVSPPVSHRTALEPRNRPDLPKGPLWPEGRDGTQSTREFPTATSFQLCQGWYIIPSIVVSRDFETKSREGEPKNERTAEMWMLDVPKPTPTCTRFKTPTEMPCIKCNDRMKLSLIEPRDERFNFVTYRCTGCSTHESFLKAI